MQRLNVKKDLLSSTISSSSEVPIAISSILASDVCVELQIALRLSCENRCGSV